MITEQLTMKISKELLITIIVILVSFYIGSEISKIYGGLLLFSYFAVMLPLDIIYELKCGYTDYWGIIKIEKRQSPELFYFFVICHIIMAVCVIVITFIYIASIIQTN